MAGMGTHTRLTRGQRRALAFAVLVVIAGMGMGFASSFATLFAAALAHHWTTPALLPLSVDSGIVAYVILDHLAVTLGAKSRWLHLAALGLAAFTVWANAAVSAADGPEWRVIHAAMPALWVLGVEALRFMWRHLHAAPPASADRIPAGRWLASPLPTFALWRRRWLLNVTSWEKMAAMEDARLYIRDRLRAATDDAPDLAVPDALARAVRTGRLPAAVLTAVNLDLEYGGAGRMEAAADSWVDGWLTRRDEVRAALEARRAAIVRAMPATTPEVTAAPPAQVTPELTSSQALGHPEVTRPATPAVRSRRKPAVRPGRISDADLKEQVRSAFAADPAVSVNAVAKALGRSRDRIRPLLEQVRADANVRTLERKRS